MPRLSRKAAEQAVREHSQRTLAGLQEAREQGRIGGRRSQYTDAQVLATQHMVAAVAARRLGMSQPGYAKRLAAALGRVAEGKDAE